MAELGSHQLDVVNWVLKTTPKRVVAAGGIDYWRDGREVFDNIFCTYEYELPAAGQKLPGPPPASVSPAGPPAARFASPIRRWATTPTKGPRS